MVSVLVTIIVCIVLLVLIIYGLGFVEMDGKLKNLLIFAIVAIIIIYLILGLVGKAPMIHF